MITQLKFLLGKNSLESYRFTETGTNSGIFTAEIILTGFTHDADGEWEMLTLLLEQTVMDLLTAF